MTAVPQTPEAINYWPQNKCAKAFWSQRELPPYKQLLADTLAWIDPRPGQRWIDLGCGSGQLTRAVWEKSGGRVAEVVALDCAAANEHSIAKLRRTVAPTPLPYQMRFQCADFSNGLDVYPDDTFHGAVSGLAIQYAEHYSPQEGRWTTAAYDGLLAEVRRVLVPGGTFTFSVNVPEPAWSKVAFSAVHGFFLTRQPMRYLKNAMRMMRYGRWLKEEARKGRFHYLPAETIVRKLQEAGFAGVEHRVSFAKQAYVVRCRKPA